MQPGLRIGRSGTFAGDRVGYLPKSRRLCLHGHGAPIQHMSLTWQSTCTRVEASGSGVLVPEQTSEDSAEIDRSGEGTVSGKMQNSPIGRQVMERQALHAKVSGLNGQPFTAAFLAAATGRDTSQESHQGNIHGCIAYQGGAGSSSAELASQLQPQMQPLPCTSYEDVFLAVTSFAADKALIPVENSMGGSVMEVLDLFLRYQVSIERETFATTHSCLAGRPGSRKADVSRVLSDTASLVECEAYLKSIPGVTRETAANGGLAAQSAIADVSGHTAAIVTERTAEMYGLEILDRNIQDNKAGDITRYLLLSREAVKLAKGSPGKHKTSVVFSFPEKPGLLFNCLSVFALRDINLTKIESRPLRDEPMVMDPELGRKFQYRFHVDFIGSLAETSVQNAIVHLKEVAPFVKILGCYPAGGAGMTSPAVETIAAEEVREQIANHPHSSNGASSGGSENGSLDSDSLLISVAASLRPIQQEKRNQAGMRVAYQGNPGAYSESAALAAFPDGHPVPCEQFEDAFQALSQFLTDRAVLPIENSLGGSIHAVYDLLIQYKLYIIGEVTVAVNHCLLTLPGVEKKDLKRVISHYQALAQVDGYTRNMGVVREAVDDTAGAAQMVADNQWRDTAAVASARAGELYGLQALDTGIQDNKNNITRFLVLSRDPRVQAPSSNILCKTSVVFSLKEGPGELFKACSVFALRKLDMTKIESRPLRLTNSDTNRPSFRYLFYVDFVASMADETGQNALRHLTELATFIRVLGCYPLNMQQ